MSRSTIRVESPSDELLNRLNSRVYPVCEMVRRPDRLQAEYSVPEKYATWFTPEQIRLCGLSAKSHVVSALRTLADRFESG